MLFRSRVHARALGIIAVVSALPVISAAQERGRARSLADKLRYGPGVANHPVNVVPSTGITIPQGWPVETDGSITCLTCHRQLPSLEGNTDPYLRSNGDTQGDSVRFCGNCHNDREKRSARSMHWQATRTAHHKGASSLTSVSSGRIDTQSQRCLSCHDGVTAKESRNTLGSSIIGPRGSLGSTHPIGVPYPRAGSDGHKSQYTSAFMLPQVIQLPGGVVSCVSCHNLYARDRYLLAVRIEESALCFTCHSMK